jgi:D-aspartate ligase
VNKARQPGDGPTAIFVLRLRFTGLDHCQLAITRSAGRLGVPVFGVDRGGASVAASRYCAGQLAFDPDAPVEQKIEQLIEIGVELGRPLLVPIDDESSVLVNDHAAALHEAFLFPRQPAGLARRLSDKGELHHLCNELDIPTPVTEFPRSRADVERYARDGPFPVMVKRRAAWYASYGRRQSVAIARDSTELLEAYDRMESPEVPNVLLQEYVPGSPRSIWMFDGYFNERSDCLVGYTGIKIRQSGQNTGAATLGACIPNEQVRRDTLRLMKAIDYRGIVDMGYRYDARDGRFKLLDVNPRIGSTFRLFVGASGVDVLRALYLDLTGRPVPDPGPCERRKWIVEGFDALSAFRASGRGEVSVREWLRSLRGVREAAWFARDDPLPFAVMCLEFAAHLTRRRLRAARHRRVAEPAVAPGTPAIPQGDSRPSARHGAPRSRASR